ncbi:hypothetical protein FGO68_gene4042 [Halteria grandinella]|uniref:Uncharacterized protein n=1 Tax=Halteria grandinella TaxID=5974 RepID=A0A8J8T302_HALGN|nr:hypothetical protein FGO68_gene4042 [Halteria grandinella]
MFKKAYQKPALRSVRSYNTLIERQTNYMPVNMDTTMFINLFEGLSLTYGLSLPQILQATQVSLRLMHLPIQYVFKKIIPDSELMKQHDLAYRRYIFNDLERDCARYTIPSVIK